MKISLAVLFLGEGRVGEVWPENELYEEWRNAHENERLELEKKLYAAFKRHAEKVIANILPEGFPGLSHDIAVAALQGLPKFDGRSKPSTWVHSIALLHCYGVIRAKVRRRSVIDDSREFNEEDFPQPAHDPVPRIAITQVASHLTRKEHRLLNYMLAGLDQNELAKRLAISPNAADLRRRRLHRKIEKLCRR